MENVLHRLARLFFPADEEETEKSIPAPASGMISLPCSRNVWPRRRIMAARMGSARA